MMIALLPIIFFCVGSIQAQSWSYSNVSAWSLTWPACSGDRQSPVNFFLAATVYEDFPPLKFSEGYFSTMRGEMINNGHAVQFNVNPNREALTVSGGPLNGSTYQFAQFHLHWGAANSRGAEHTVNGKSFPMEVHLVHFNQAYGNVSASLAHPDGLLVLTFWYRIRKNAPTQTPLSLKPLLEVGQSLLTPGDTAEVRLSLGHFLLEAIDLSSYYTYEGSLTTPPCSEAARFIIFKRPLSLNRPPKILRDFLRMTVDDHGDPLVDNFRPINRRNGRQVKRTFMN